MRFSYNITSIKKFNRWFSPHEIVLLISIDHFSSVNHICFRIIIGLLLSDDVLFIRALIIKNWIWIGHLIINILISSFFVWLSIWLLFVRIRTWYVGLRTQGCYALGTTAYFFTVRDPCYYLWTRLLLLNSLSLHLYFTLWVYNLDGSFNIWLICIEWLVVLCCVYRLIYWKHVGTVHV